MYPAMGGRRKDPMKRKLLIRGRVHGVGYRPFLLALAELLDIERFYAENVTVDKEEAVEVLIDDEEEKVEEFTKIVRERKPMEAEVKKVEIEEYSGPVMKTESYYRFLTASQLSMMASYGRELLRRMDTMLSKQDKSLSNQEKMLSKQDEMLSRQDETLGELRGLRQDLKALLDERLARIERDLAAIKARLGMA